jgi:hypothetical protein
LSGSFTDRDGLFIRRACPPGAGTATVSRRPAAFNQDRSGPVTKALHFSRRSAHLEARCPAGDRDYSQRFGETRKILDPENLKAFDLIGVCWRPSAGNSFFPQQTPQPNPALARPNNKSLLI